MSSKISEATKAFTKASGEFTEATEKILKMAATTLAVAGEKFEEPISKDRIYLLLKEQYISFEVDGSDSNVPVISINLYKFIFNKFGDNAMLEDNLLIDVVKDAVRIADNAIEIAGVDTHHRNMKIGVSGMSDLMAALGFKYGTKQGTAFQGALHQLIATSAVEESILLAKERGACDSWNMEADSESEFLTSVFDKDNMLMTESTFKEYDEFGLRNASLINVLSDTLADESFGVSTSILPYKEAEGDIRNHKAYIEWFGVINECNFETAKTTLLALPDVDAEKIFATSPWFQATMSTLSDKQMLEVSNAIRPWVSDVVELKSV